jgi:hypothetical protein
MHQQYQQLVIDTVSSLVVALVGLAREPQTDLYLNRVQSDALCRTQSGVSSLKVYSLKSYAACVPKVDVRSDLSIHAEISG